MTYFHERMLTIIGAAAFHGPVRDGKGWFHRAMVVRHEGLPCWGFEASTANLQEKYQGFSRLDCVCDAIHNRQICQPEIKVIGSSLTGN